MVGLDHVTAPVRDLRAARKFYRAALGAIGMRINLDVSSAFGMGSKDEKIFWLSRDRGASGNAHYAFRVASRAEVDAFHAAAIKAGGTDHGKPGPRPDYGRNYYAAFVKDPEGNNLEVVCYAPAARKRPRATASPRAKARTGAKPRRTRAAAPRPRRRAT
jgi:catechol 2,3-dioxygenase-like lactoylglutathione lyase family enzyme